MESVAQAIDRFNNSIGIVDAWAALPMVLMLFLLVMFPQLAIWLPELLFG